MRVDSLHTCTKRVHPCRDHLLAGHRFGGAPGGMGGMPDFSALLGQQLPAPGATTGAAPAPVQDPAVRFADQLRQLRDMGFTDEQRNIEALTATMGNVNAA
eukprot:42456-Eustigmatos_ZCMA.PRE.1